VVFDRAIRRRIRFKLTKCSFVQTRVSILGSLAAEGYVEACPKRIQGIVQWPRPTSFEEVESFLATCNFMRDHLNPKFSEVSFPLRQALKPLQEARASGKHRKVFRPKGQPKEERGDQEAPPWWGAKEEEAFQACKAMVAEACRLHSPDHKGAMNGTNPYHIYVDACNYAVGGVLMQRPPATVAEDASLPDYYRVLQSAPNVTKAELEASVRALRKQHQVQPLPLRELKRFDEACEVLLNVGLRKEYDAKRGLGSRKHSDLVLIGCFSQSLSAAQRNWTTWEKELLGGSRIIGHFSTIVMGTFTVMHTDHINSTLMPVELKNPDKILRMLLHLESSVQLTWRFVSGIANPAGDGFSRNPPDRDAVKDDVDSKPKTFGEAWQMARGSAKSQEDTDFVIRAVNILDNEISGLTIRDHFDDLIRWKGYQPVCVRPQYDAVTGDEVLAAAFAPGYVGEEDEVGLSSHTVTGPEVVLKREVVIQPPLIAGIGSRRWLEKFQSLPLAKRDWQKLRNVALDGILVFVRAVAQNALPAIVAHTEAALVLAASLSPLARQACLQGEICC